MLNIMPVISVSNQKLMEVRVFSGKTHTQTQKQNKKQLLVAFFAVNEAKHYFKEKREEMAEAI